MGKKKWRIRESTVRGKGGRGGGESCGSLIAQTTGVSLITCFVGGDEKMKGRVSPFLVFLLFFFTPGSRHIL